MSGVNNREGMRGRTPANVMRADENTDSKTAATRDSGLKMALMERMFALAPLCVEPESGERFALFSLPHAASLSPQLVV